MRFLFLLSVVLGIAACQSTHQKVESPTTIGRVTFSGTDGLTKETAIVVSGTKNSQEAIDAQYDWVDQHHPGAIVKSVSLEGGDGIYDVYVLKLPSGKTRKLYFNITSYMHRK